MRLSTTSLSLVKAVSSASSCSYPTAPTLTAARLSSLRERLQRQIAVVVATSVLKVESLITEVEVKMTKKAAKVTREGSPAANPEANPAAAKRMVRRVERVVENQRVAKVERASTVIRSASCSLTSSSLFRTESFALTVMILCAFWFVTQLKPTESKI